MGKRDQQREQAAADALAALGNRTRLRIFKLYASISSRRFKQVLAPAGGMNMPAPLREAGQERASEPKDRAPICIVAGVAGARKFAS